MKLKTSTHIVIADSEKYLILYNQGDEDIMDLRVLDIEVRDNPPAREQGTDKPGRFLSPNAQYSSAAQTDWHQLEKEQAATDLADRINKLSDNSELLLIADAKTLGLIRPQLSANIQAKLIDEIPKDLAHHTIPEIEKLIRAA
jgi:protein required for attachment to host cells